MSGCRLCLYWATRDGRVGQCRRYAPRPVTTDGDRVARAVYWPMTAAADGCGDGRIDLERADDDEDSREAESNR